MSVGSTHHLEMVFVWKQNYILVDEYFFFCCTWIVNSAYKKISPLLRKGENEINQWADRHSVEHATVQAIQWLTRAPDRFSAAQFSPLLEHEKSSTQIINLLVWSGLCGWINRLKIALGETY